MPDSVISFEDFSTLPHAITLLGMSGVGKTMLSTSLRSKDNWFHYSADYRIGTRYLSEHILDNIKFKIMTMGDAFVANLLRSDSIYISHNISVDNLDPVSTFLGLFGDEKKGGLNKSQFLERQDLYRSGEIESMKDVSRFIEKAWRIYQCKNFLNDASGSLCEIVDPDNDNDPVIEALRAETLILYIQPDTVYEEALMRRARENPKPLFYNPEFIAPKLTDQPQSGQGVEPMDFAMPLFPELVSFRRPRYEKIATKYGYTIAANELFALADSNGEVPNADLFLKSLYNVVMAQIQDSETARANLAIYLDACEKRSTVRQ
jgi:hypothetical protein